MSLLDLVREHALSFGEFRLASGQISTYYIDLSKVVNTATGLQAIVTGLWESVESWDEFDSIGGPALGAIPIVAALMLESEVERSFCVRKEQKEYGKLDVIEGNLRAGDRVLMVEDVTTTGGSLLKAIQAVEKEGGVVKKILSVLDREAGAKNFFKEKGYELISLLSVSDVLGKDGEQSSRCNRGPQLLGGLSE